MKQLTTKVMVLIGISANNDNLCVKIIAEKFVDKENPRIEFKIVTID